MLGRVWPLAGEAAELVYQFEQPFIVDGSRCAAAFDITPTSYEEGVRATLVATAERLGCDFVPASVSAQSPESRPTTLPHQQPKSQETGA